MMSVSLVAWDRLREKWRNAMTDRMEFQEIEEKECAMRGLQLSAMSFEVVAMAVLLLLGLCAPAAHSQGYDLVINNGRVIDPESKLDAIRSIGGEDRRYFRHTAFRKEDDRW